MVDTQLSQGGFPSAKICGQVLDLNDPRKGYVFATKTSVPNSVRNADVTAVGRYTVALSSDFILLLFLILCDNIMQLQRCIYIHNSYGQSW